MTGNIKPRYFASRSLDVAIVGDDDGLDARAQARPSPDDVGHIQCLSRRHDACLEQLQARMGDGRDFLLQNAPLALVERVEVRRAKRPQITIVSAVPLAVALWEGAPSCEKPKFLSG